MPYDGRAPSQPCRWDRPGSQTARGHLRHPRPPRTGTPGPGRTTRQSDPPPLEVRRPPKTQELAVHLGERAVLRTALKQRCRLVPATSVGKKQRCPRTRSPSEPSATAVFSAPGEVYHAECNEFQSRSTMAPTAMWTPGNPHDNSTYELACREPR